VYTGQFLNDMIDGHGTFKCAAYTYTGNFCKSKYSGYGELTEKVSGVKFIGNWLNDLAQYAVAQRAALVSESHWHQVMYSPQDCTATSSSSSSEPHTKKKAKLCSDT
jgi:MORN repeat